MKSTTHGRCGRIGALLVLAISLEGALGRPATAQEVRMVEVDGREVRVQTSGLERAGGEAPVIVFEAGFMYDGLSAWTSILGDVAEFAPVVAYDRAGIGGSEPDGVPPTARHVVNNLRGLLRTLGAEPPYLLVGHSLGGPFIRMFAELFPEEVSGLVLIDPTPTTSEEARREFESAMGLSEDSRLEVAELQRAQIPGMPSASVRAEAEMLMSERLNHWPDFQELRPLPDVPVAILMAARYEPRPHDGLERTCEPRQCHQQEVEVRREWLAGLLSEVRRGWLTVVTDSGHFIQNDDPELVVWTIRRAWSSEPLRTELRLSADILDQLVGEYRRDARTSLTVTREYDQLFAQVTGQGTTAIFAETETEFYWRYVQATLTFERDPAGSVTAAVLRQGGRETRWERAP